MNLRTFSQSVYAGLAALALAVTAPAANAALVTFDLSWDGTSFGNTASATGSITLDTALLPNPGFYGGPLAGVGVTDLSVIVTGASAGNGSFGLVDFSDLVWDAFPAVDLGQELVGQAGFNDFNLFAAAAPAPTGTIFFELTTNAGTGDPMALVSMVPAPASIALLAIGMLGLALRRRSRTAA